MTGADEDVEMLVIVPLAVLEDMLEDEDTDEADDDTGSRGIVRCVRL